MAFVFKAERPHITLATETAKLTNIGPGSYGKLESMTKRQNST